MRPFIRSTVLVAALLLISATARAHVGSEDVYFDGQAGPYKLFLTVRPPPVIPGVADVQIRAADTDIDTLRIVPLPLLGDGARFAPTPDVATRLRDDPQTYSGHLWMMTTGAWQVRVLASGKRGSGELTVPVPTLSRRTVEMKGALAALLCVLLGVLVFGMISIVGASAGVARLSPGEQPGTVVQARSRRAMVATAILLGFMVIGGGLWWQGEAEHFALSLYKPLRLDATIAGSKLQLQLQNSGGRWPSVDDLVPDHDHLMHLFVLRMPQMDSLMHLHPQQTGSGLFTQDLPTLAAGSYRLYADIVHKTGIPETLVADLTIPAPLDGKPLSGDDSAGTAPPLSSADATKLISPLSDGGRAVYSPDAQPLRAKSPRFFRFRIEARPDEPAQDLELYMGMLGHAAFVKRDGSVFSHLHPTGSVPMAMLDLAQRDGTTSDPHAAHKHVQAATLPSEISFPYGFPQAGDYRIFIQIKRKSGIQTASFDLHVDPAAP